jgi:hypothetical protein
VDLNDHPSIDSLKETILLKQVYLLEYANL